MTEVRIPTLRGVTLSGTLLAPTASQPGTAAPNIPGIVIMAHDFLADRHGSEGRLDDIAQAYRDAGWATLSYDFSGLGSSDDDVVRLDGEVEDLQAVCSWLTEQGYQRQAIHAHGFGATAALVARPESVRTLIVVGALVGPQSVEWDEVFSDEQLDDLATYGQTRLLDDNPNDRTWAVVSKQTLADVSLQSIEHTMAQLPWPILMVHGALTDEYLDSESDAATGFPLLPDGSQLVHVRAESEQQARADIARLGIAWLQRRLR